MLEMVDVQDRLEHLMGLMESENDILQMEKRIRGRVKRQMEKNQREYYLNEQMKAIQKELGELEEAPNEIEDWASASKRRACPRSEDQGLGRAEQAQADVAHVRRGDGGAQLRGHPGQRALEEAHQDPQRSSRRRKRCWKPITTGWRRSRSASWSTWRCSSGCAS